jgi:hypothetical protein
MRQKLLSERKIRRVHAILAHQELSR